MILELEGDSKKGRPRQPIIALENKNHRVITLSIQKINAANDR